MFTIYYYLRHRRWMEVMFPPLSVCLFVNNNKSCGWIRTKFCGELGYVTRTK